VKFSSLFSRKSSETHAAKPPTAETIEPALVFVGEQDGSAETILREELWKGLYRWGNVISAYLFRAHPQNSQEISVHLGLRVKNGTDASLLDAMRPLVAEGLPGGISVNITFLTPEQEIELVKVCRPFYPERLSSPNPYSALRDNVLKGTRETLHLPSPSSRVEPWGVVMDWGVVNGCATVVAFSDGNASLYLSGGGGAIGGKGVESIRNAAQRAVIAAAAVQPQTQIAPAFPLPKTGEVSFYLLTDSGVFTSAATVEEMGHGHPLAKVGGAMQQIIAGFRADKTKK
jgi:hypothetical protein